MSFAGNSRSRRKYRCNAYNSARVHCLKVCACSVSCLLSLTFMAGCAATPAAPAAPPPTSAQVGTTSIVAVAPPAGASMTLPEFLGLKGLAVGVRKLGVQIRSRLGMRFPGLEPKPPLRPITDPANSSEDASPAVQAAAEAKAEEDQAAQKAKAIRYLASLGCGECYPDTADALLAALEDCSEQIRFETVRGLRKSAGGPCQLCRQNSCCTPELLEKLYEIGYGKDEYGCFIEPSSRVRRYARLVICGCGGTAVVDDSSAELPREGPTEADAQPSEAPADTAEPIPAPEEAAVNRGQEALDHVAAKGNSTLTSLPAPPSAVQPASAVIARDEPSIPDQAGSTGVASDPSELYRSSLTQPESNQANTRQLVP